MDSINILAINIITMSQIVLHTKLEAAAAVKNTPPPLRKPIIAKPWVNRMVGLFILITLGGIVWVYGFSSEIRYGNEEQNRITGLGTTQQKQTLFGNLQVLASVFTLISFGLLFSHFKKNTSTAIFAPLFVISFTTIISPIFQKFWFNVFFTDFKGTVPTPLDPTRLYQLSLAGLQVYLDFYNLKISLANSIAQLVALLGLYGRINFSHLIVNSFFFNFVWNLNHFLCSRLVLSSPDNRFFDDYQITSVYLFSAVYSAIVSLFLKKPKTELSDHKSKNSNVLALLGNFFLFLAFCTTSTLYPAKHSAATYKAQDQSVRSYAWPEAWISVFFAMSASVIFYYAFSVLVSRKKRVEIRGSMIGTLAGAIIYGPIAGTCENIGAAIAVGLFSGIISAFFFEKLYPKINKRGIRDSLGGLLVLAISLIGSLIVAPIILIAYKNAGLSLQVLSKSKVDKASVAQWVLSYVGISAGIGLIGGCIFGLLMKAMQRRRLRFFQDLEFFVKGYGLRKTESQERYLLQEKQQISKSNLYNAQKSNAIEASKTHFKEGTSQEQIVIEQ